jgi:hypothetical protein
MARSAPSAEGSRFLLDRDAGEREHGLERCDPSVVRRFGSSSTMSYDIFLYQKRFLKRALEEGLGDWTGADPIPAEKLRLIRERLKGKGYVTEDGEEFEHANSTWGLQVSFFPGEVAFAIPYWDDAAAAIEAARAEAMELARELDLGFYDPQTGEAIT